MKVLVEGKRNLGQLLPLSLIVDAIASDTTFSVDGGFRLELTEQDGLVQDVYTHGGFNHIRQFAALCQREGWRMADSQEGEDVDLDDPQRWMEERSG